MSEAKPQARADVKHFSRSSVIQTSLAAITSFHEEPGALAHLTPPPLTVRLLRDDRRSLREGEVEFSLGFGPVSSRWLARHEPGPNPHSFADVQLRGPLAHWRHEHIFEESANGVKLTDSISFGHRAGPRGWLTRLIFGGLPLRILFAYRHWQTRRALEA